MNIGVNTMSGDNFLVSISGCILVQQDTRTRTPRLNLGRSRNAYLRCTKTTFVGSVLRILLILHRRSQQASAYVIFVSHIHLHEYFVVYLLFVFHSNFVTFRFPSEVLAVGQVCSYNAILIILRYLCSPLVSLYSATHRLRFRVVE